ncbi:toast rack family protein [Peribacillus alkalitolerans]|uniref:toast rack family protein n=1 Tax=Peribacillus alkalitolerans TaxID=1550385 RepID=UPI0013D6AE51|nr:toast rack family protein [Peribacillus alkalitolerans]
MKKSINIGLVIGALLLFTTGCNSVVTGKVKEENISVNKDKAKELEVELNLGVGEMMVTNGANEWVEGSIRSNIKNFEPKVSYDLDGKKGKVVIEQSKQKFKNMKIGNIENEWNLMLSEDIPMSLDVNVGAASTKLDLKGIELKDLDIDAGVGNLTVDLGGDWEDSFETNIKAGVGKTTIVLPSEVGVKITSKKGIGSTNIVDFISKGDGVYVNEAYEDADVIITVNTDLGVGEVTFKLDK